MKLPTLVPARMRAGRAALTIAALVSAGLAVVRFDARAGEDCRYEITQDTSQRPVVLDHLTGLTWERFPDTSKHLSWDEAGLYCGKLNGGQPEGWRLPTVQELQSILDDTRSPPFDGSTFQDPSNAQDRFWTITQVAALPGNAWVIDFQTGEITNVSKGESHEFRCVR